MDAMAAAVEGAHCVLICITERYKVRACAAACFLPHGATTDRGVARRQDALLTLRVRGRACRRAPTAGSRAHVRPRLPCGHIDTNAHQRAGGAWRPW